MNISYVPRSAVQTRLSLGWTIVDCAPHPSSWAVLMQIPEIEVDTPVPCLPEPGRVKNKSRRERPLRKFAGAA